MAHVNWLQLSPEEFIDRKKECPICYMPYGLAECHGTYNYLGVDWYPVSKVCEKAAEKKGGVVAPHFAWHVDEEPEFNWSIRGCGMGEFICASIPAYMFFHNILYHLRAFDARGFKTVMLVSGHAVQGTNHDINLMIDYYKRKTGSPIQAEYFCYFELFEKGAFPGISKDHGGDMETACAYGANPEHAPAHLLGEPMRYPEIGGGNEKRAGYNAPAKFENKAGRGEDLTNLGTEALDYLSDRLAERAKKLLDKYEEPTSPHMVPNYYELEEIWTSFEKNPHRYWKTNVTWDEYAGKREHPDFPGGDWFMNK